MTDLELITDTDEQLIETLPAHLRPQARQQIARDRVALALAGDRRAFAIDRLERAAILAAKELDASGPLTGAYAADRFRRVTDELNLVRGAPT